MEFPVISKLRIPDEVPYAALAPSLARESDTNPPSFYITGYNSDTKLVIYNRTASTVAIVDIADFGSQIKQRNPDAMALKVFLESSPITKVFWDARGLANKLYQNHGIVLDNKTGGQRTYIHEAQIMELACRTGGNRKYQFLSGMEACVGKLFPIEDMRPFSSRHFDTLVLRLPELWEKYHGELVKGGDNAKFWIKMVRETTTMRLMAAMGWSLPHFTQDDADSGWDDEYVMKFQVDWQETVAHRKLLGDEFWDQYQQL